MLGELIRGLDGCGTVRVRGRCVRLYALDYNMHYVSAVQFRVLPGQIWVRKVGSGSLGWFGFESVTSAVDYGSEPAFSVPPKGWRGLRFGRVLLP